eukprot:TRINITY_DN25713_c0_g1_i1.p1 TRINITY_DN25713_c0_g1~~TRINITY_DN25713_c0_g1_i1.p1  ORF type:complete len:142 (-),score=37.11 TRINITY_DN25713_c0_g1_i1:64-489(-)
MCIRDRIYQTITDRGGGESRETSKKFNAVYPFIIPVSAHTGENMDLLRGMLVETSGLIQGHKLRKLLRRKTQEANRLAETDEIRRIEAARELEKQIGIEEYTSRSEHSLSLIHISEPTRLLSISYAVFCLKKKKIIHKIAK